MPSIFGVLFPDVEFYSRDEAFRPASLVLEEQLFPLYKNYFKKSTTFKEIRRKMLPLAVKDPLSNTNGRPYKESELLNMPR